MFRFLQRAWRTLAPLILLVVANFAVWRLANHTVAFKISATFWNAESALGLWTMDGMALNTAIAIGIACSTYDLFMWYWMFHDIHVLCEWAEDAYGDIMCRRRLRSSPRWKRT